MFLIYCLHYLHTWKGKNIKNMFEHDADQDNTITNDHLNAKTYEHHCNWKNEHYKHH